MKFLVSLALIILLSFIAGMYFPWWSICVVAFLVSATIPQRAFMSFLSGFTALFILWAVLSFWISNSNGHILAHKAALLVLKVDNPYFLMLVTAFIGALVGGLGALTGSYLRKIPPIEISRS